MQREYIDSVQLLCPFGNWAHPKGMQVVDKTACEKIRNNFMRSLARIRGLPIYVGHPDDKGGIFPLKSAGKIQSVCITGQGLVICARYERKVFSEIQSGRLKWLSPRWQMEKLKDGYFRPVRLISAGLTNCPNIPSSGSMLLSYADFEKSVSEVEKMRVKLSLAIKKIAECIKAEKAVSAEAEFLKNEKMDENIAKLNQKPQAFEMAAMALALAKENGGDYAASFSKIRRKYYGAAKTKEFMG